MDVIPLNPCLLRTMVRSSVGYRALNRTRVSDTAKSRLALSPIRAGVGVSSGETDVSKKRRLCWSNVRFWLEAVVSDVTVQRPLRARKPTSRCLVSTLTIRTWGIAAASTRLVPPTTLSESLSAMIYRRVGRVP